MSEKNKNTAFKIFFLLAGLTSAAIFILQHLLIWYKVWRLGEKYNFFSFTHPDPYTYWAPMFRDILDGHSWITDGRIWEHQFLPSLWSLLDPLIAAPIILLFRDMSHVFLAGGFLSVLATFFIFYFIAKELSGHRVFSLVFTFVFATAMLIWDFLFPVSMENLRIIGRGVFHLGSPTTDILMSRYISLSIFPTLPFFAATFLSILKAVKTGRRAWLAASGFFAGFLIYMVITDAIYIFAGLSFLILLLFLSKEYVLAKKFLRIFVFAALTSSLYWFNFSAIRLLPWADEFYRRLGGDFSHGLRLSLWPKYAGYIVMALLIWLWGRRYTKQKEAMFIIAFVLAPIGVLNMQVVTGFNPQPTVWFTHQFYFGFALGWMALIFWIFSATSGSAQGGKCLNATKWKYGFTIAAAILITLLTSRVIYTNIFIARDQYKHHIMPKDIYRSLKWLESNTPRDSVVVTPSLISNVLIPVESGNRTFIPSGVSSPAAQAEILDRIFVVYKLFDVSPEYLHQALRRSDDKSDEFALNQENSLMIWIYDTYFFDTSLDSFFRGRKGNNLPKEIIDRDVAAYKNYPANLQYLLNRYKIDYFYVGPYERKITSLDFDKLSFLERIYSQDEIFIYKIKRNI